MAYNVDASVAFFAKSDELDAQRRELDGLCDDAIENGDPELLERLLEEKATLVAEIERRAVMAEAHRRAIERSKVEAARERLQGELSEQAASIGERAKACGERIRAAAAEMAEAHAEMRALDQERYRLANIANKTANRAGVHPIPVPRVNGAAGLADKFVEQVATVATAFTRGLHEWRVGR